MGTKREGGKKIGYIKRWGVKDAHKKVKKRGRDIFWHEKMCNVVAQRHIHDFLIMKLY